ncbi:MAG: pilus assembly protein [Shinella sp.]|nr:pilus assembly protein [Shinella sp.]
MKDVAGRRFSLSRLMADRLGNFGMMTALVLPVLFGAGSLALDVTNMMMTKSRLQGAADSAALAAASAIANDNYTPDQARELALNFMKAQMGNGDIASRTNVNITESTNADSSKSYKVVVNAAYTLDFNPVTKLFRGQSTDMNAASTAESAPGSGSNGSQYKTAVSMYLVLDKSGSMLADTNQKIEPTTYCPQYNVNGQLIKNSHVCYVKKIEALKLAAAALFTQLNKADPEKNFVRTGAVSYNNTMGAATNLAWGTAGSSSAVNALSAGGGTSSTTAMDTAHKKLKAASENTAHQNKNGQIPEKYIVFMTDGDNNNSSDDVRTKQICTDAKTEGMTIYSVAFMAPDKGQKLLRDCASSAEYFFKAEDMAQLISAFESIGKKVAAITARLTH